MVALFAEPLQEVFLYSPRLYLRPPARRDYRQWSELRTHSRSFLEPWEPAWPEDALSRSGYRRRWRRALSDWNEDLGYSFHLFRRADDVLVGGLGLNNVRRGVAQTASVGYWTGQPHAGDGYMSEALGVVLEFAFRQLRLHRVEAACLPSNRPSRRVLEKTGFKNEGLARKYLRINGAWEDHLLFGILCDDSAEPVPKSPILVSEARRN